MRDPDELPSASDQPESWEDHQTRSLLSLFADQLDYLSRYEPVIFFPPFVGKGFQIESVSSDVEGLALQLHDYGSYFLRLEKISGNSFYRKHGHDVWIVPPWLRV
jgi:hypothetical protein